MERAIAKFAVEKLGDLIIREGKHLYGVKGKVKKLDTELEWMHTFLQTVAQRNVEDEMVRKYVVEIQGVAYDAEDVIQTYILKRYINIKILSTLHKIGSDIKAINVKISDITERLKRYGINLNQKAAQGSNSEYERLIDRRRSYSHVEEDDIVGLDNDVEQLVNELVKSKKHVAIWGMGGLGKTTLAKKIYRHSQIRDHFDRFSWTCISQQWNKKDVLRKLLIGLQKPLKEERGEINIVEEEELAERLYEFHEQSKCLVVLDDVWSTDVLESIYAAFPRTMSGSKILLTTRIRDVGTHMGQESVLHELRFLNEEESWYLFQKKTLSRRDAAGTSITNFMRK